MLKWERGLQENRSDGECDVPGVKDLSKYVKRKIFSFRRNVFELLSVSENLDIMTDVTKP